MWFRITIYLFMTCYFNYSNWLYRIINCLKLFQDYSERLKYGNSRSILLFKQMQARQGAGRGGLLVHHTTITRTRGNVRTVDPCDVRTD